VAEIFDKLRTNTIYHKFQQTNLIVKTNRLINTLLEIVFLIIVSK